MMVGPTRTELLAATRGWLESEPAATDGFLRKVAANAMGIVGRELEIWPAEEAAALERLSAILKETGDFETLTVALAEAIRDGRINGADPMVADHLKRTALAQLAVDQPRYRHSLIVTE